MLALTAVQNALEDWRLEGCTIRVTKEPRLMCAWCECDCRPVCVVYGCPDLKGVLPGVGETSCNRNSR